MFTISCMEAIYYNLSGWAGLIWTAYTGFDLDWLDWDLIKTGRNGFDLDWLD